MPEAQRTIVIDRPENEVFSFFTDPSNDPKWRSGIKKIAADGPIRVGSIVRQVVSGPGGRGIRADYLVTVYEPTSRYAFEVIAGPVRPVGEYRFAPSTNGVQVTFSLSAELSGLKRLLLARQVQNSMQRDAASLDRAKALIEST